jgi:hypothetical protein
LLLEVRVGDQRLERFARRTDLAQAPEYLAAWP